ncbi:phosphatase PAP2 family protein [Nannocystis pusilla]|uniref:Phosphatase PAP2 family protein n=1 Tax=Nannocystis pusilla TaxID=889268 RepID=A0ABS7TKS4_9BACT|nr:phosphatase PAP2 family protein [Nannocystis pusilla]MBZ5708831.1 phosphatase PAP2 family protein [Nannocystis pusilla]
MSRRLLSALLVALLAPPVAAHPLVPGRVALSLAPDASAPPALAPLDAWAPSVGPSGHAPQDRPPTDASPASTHVPEDISHNSTPSPAAHPPGTSPQQPAPPSGHTPEDISAAPSAPAPPALPPHLMRIRPAIDVPVIGLGLALWLGSDLAARDSSWAGCAACDRSRINGLDRRVLGNDNPAAAHASDALLYTAIAAPLVADLADALVTGRRAPGSYRRAAGGWARDVVVLFQVLAVNVGLTNLVKYAVRRPRPYSYDQDNSLGDIRDEEARLSFYSGHASTAFAMMTAWATIFTLRHSRARAAVPVWLAAIGIAATTALLRVEAGKHFWTDVIAGSIAGTSIGVLVPTLHRSDLGKRLSFALRPSPRGALFNLTGRF